jgi:fermentation-respiration switch protein FrsA (DUF1100 family)
MTKVRLHMLGQLIRWGLILYLGILLFCMLFENAFIFPAPRFPRGDWNPSDLQFEDVQFSSQDGTRLHGWYFAHPQPRAVLLYCHGNGDFVPNLGDHADLLRVRYQLSVLVFDYRGYGKSGGRPNEAGVLADARAARDWLARTCELAPTEVVLMGRSLGGAVAVDLAAEAGCRALVLESTFTSMPDVAAYHFPWLPVRRLMRTQLNSEQRIQGYGGPLLQSHGTKDEVVPFELGKRLFDAAPGQKQFIPLTGGRHNDPQPPLYYEILGSFLDHILG